MKVVILAGGYGTRISEESYLKPKPMVEIGDQPILWHVMKIYSYYGFNEFIICAGYKQHMVKEYFDDYYLHRSDITYDFTDGGARTVHNNVSEPWKVTIVDTGLNTMTGGRVKRIRPYIGNEPFLLTYGDGVSDIDISALVKFHQENGKLVTLTAIQPGERFGVLSIDSDSTIRNFKEKRKDDGGWVNGGFMVMQPEIFDFIEGDDTVLERDPMETLASKGQLSAYHHHGFWQCMDTLRDKLFLESLLEKNEAPWKKW
jgi:glucose-1-phosphate cytidylyltransferase